MMQYSGVLIGAESAYRLTGPSDCSQTKYFAQQSSRRQFKTGQSRSNFRESPESDDPLATLVDLKLKLIFNFLEYVRAKVKPQLVFGLKYIYRRRTFDLSLFSRTLFSICASICVPIEEFLCRNSSNNYKILNRRSSLCTTRYHPLKFIEGSASRAQHTVQHTHTHHIELVLDRNMIQDVKKTQTKYCVFNVFRRFLQQLNECTDCCVVNLKSVLVHYLATHSVQRVPRTAQIAAAAQNILRIMCISL